MKKKVTLLFLLSFVLINSHQANAADFVKDTYKIVAPPANDECATAIDLTVNSDYLCSIVTSGTIADATVSTVTVSNTDCPNITNLAKDDVWFKFTATASEHRIALTNISGSQPNLYFVVYKGSCGTLENVFCSDPNSSDISGLTVNEIYYVRVFTNDTTTGHTTTFNICVGTMPAAPTNDECTNAASVTIGTDITVDASSATNSGDVTASGCGSAMSDGVWYSIVGDGNPIKITVIPSVATWDVKIAVFTGTCGTFTCVGSANTGVAGVAEAVSFASANGTTYLINIGDPDNQTSSPGSIFNLKVETTTLAIDDLLEKGFAFYPNPVKNKLNLRANEPITSVKVYNYIGQEIRRESPSKIETTVDFKQLPVGTYFVKAAIGTKVGSFKIIKK